MGAGPYWAGAGQGRQCDNHICTGSTHIGSRNIQDIQKHTYIQTDREAGIHTYIRTYSETNIQTGIIHTVRKYKHTGIG